ncbi:hypothetical protein [Winogradskyella marincola]|uniref:Lipoprotein n=1 Tax=Winogradskyella marincola TaxID=3037795 RepID=A0ABT6G4N4_9FLAO|nr:hypothetical protein [Winogradskyella sp. YYF002]MDG4717009.1 hypothetical protein [Winogradskyella sp. YYF002]
MKNLKFLSALLFISILSLTSCQDEIDDENGNNPNTNSATSPTAQNLERSAMYDGSFDDFLDDVSCSSVLFPVTVIVDNTEITLVSESDYELVLDIIGEFTDDDDSVQFQFPITVQLSNYTQVVINNEAELDALEDACDDAEDNFEDAINCLEIDFPITILTYDANLEQSGSVVIESEQQLYNYMDNFDDDAYFSVNYPITATLSNGNTVEITSDADLENYIDECLDFDDMEDDAEDDAEDVEEILVEGTFVIESYVDAAGNAVAEFADYTIDFANDLTCTAQNVVNTTIADVEGVYQVTSDIDVYLSLTFTGNTTFELLNQTWEVTSYSENSISLQSTTNAAITVVLSQI